MLRATLLCAAMTFAGISMASAHIELENRQANIGSGYKAVMRVPHGCEGSPTTMIRVRIPEGVLDVKPMPKAGWKLDVVTGKYPKPYSQRGAKVSEGVTEISWSGGNLPNTFYDEFVFIGVISEDLLSQFKKNGMMSTDTALRYRREVLEPGGSKDAIELVRAFLGRDYNYEAFSAWVND